MAATQKFRDDHAIIMSLAKNITRSMGSDNQTIERNAAEIGANLTKLGSILKLHLTAEDNDLYPKLASHNDHSLSATAKEFQQDMAGISGAFENYSSKWNTHRIVKNPSGFKTETLQVFEVIGKRIGQEEKILYAMFDRINSM